MVEEVRYYFRKNGMYLQKYTSIDESSNKVVDYKFDSPLILDTTVFVKNDDQFGNPEDYAKFYINSFGEVAVDCEIVKIEKVYYFREVGVIE